MAIIQLRDENGVFWSGEQDDACHTCPECGHQFLMLSESLSEPDTITVECPANILVDADAAIYRTCGHRWTKPRLTNRAVADSPYLGRRPAAVYDIFAPEKSPSRE